MLSFIIILQVLVALFLILVVLLQPGNKGGVGAALGGAGGETVFGGRGANTFLAKLTLGAAVLFMLSNFSLSYMSSPRGSVVAKVLEQEGNLKAAPVAPVAETKDPVGAPPEATKKAQEKDAAQQAPQK